MDMSFANLSFDQSWFSWGVGLILAFPLAVIILGEIIHHFEKSRSIVLQDWGSILRFTQYFIMPMLVMLLIMTKVLELPVDNIYVKAVETLLWIFIIYAAISLVNLVLFSESGSGGWRIKAPKLLLDFARVIVVAIGSAIVLSSVWGFELGKMLAALGVGSIVLGLALQDTLSSLLSGFALISSRQFKEGDWLDVNGKIGKVINVNWRTVTLLNRDEDIIIIPNSDLAKGSFINFSHPYPRHVERINFDFSFDDAPYDVKKMLIEQALKTPGVMKEQKPEVSLVSYDEFSVRHEIRFWIEHYSDLPEIRDRFISSVWYAAKRHGITFPTRSHEIFMMDTADNQEKQNEMERNFKVLSESPILQGKNEAILRDMALHSRILHFAKGELISGQDDDSDEFFVMLEGEAEETYKDKTGTQYLLNKFGRGDLFGLISLVRNSPDKTSVTALSDSEILAVDEEYTHELLIKHPEVAIYIENIITTQLRELEIIEKRAGRIALTAGKAA